MRVTEEIKNRLDIVDVVSEHVALRKSGRNYAGFCPFHPNTRTPSFYVFPETQTWHCFGACAEGGDVFSFLMKKEGWDFREALEHLAKRAGVSLEETKPMEQAKQAKVTRQERLLAAAADYFHQLFLHAPQAEYARRYVLERGLQEETIAAFGLGYALDSWDACRTHFNAQGYDDDELLAAGLLTVNEERGTKYDRFRNRLMIPIRDVNGRVVGFGARTLDKDGVPKYLNSPQTDLFNKSHLLFGLDMAKRHIREARQAVIVEGYMDVIQAWQAGFRNVVAQMGTALTHEQLQLLKRYTKQFVLALDADAAGFKATMRSLEVARESLDREVNIRFDARGLLRQEGRLQADIRVVTLPVGYDPDKLIREDVTAWPKLLAKAQPVVAYVIDVVTCNLDLNDGKAKTAAARRVIPLIRDVLDPVERDHYWQMLARALHVDERALRQIRVEDGGRKRPSSSEVPVRSVAVGVGKRRNGDGETAVINGGIIATHKREANYLSQCLRHPQLLTSVNQRLTQNSQPPVREADFTTAEDKALFRHLSQISHASPFATIEDLCDSLDNVLQERVQTLLTFPPTPDSELERLADELAKSVLDWRLEKTRRLLNEVKQLFDEAKEMNDIEAIETYKEQLRRLPLIVFSINRARDAMSAVSRRKADDSANNLL
ncbi:MAG: DNA primase [Chloroflexi bacterium]|nr:MAG: DNA primase [Chloroflexota bacterium]